MPQGLQRSLVYLFIGLAGLLGGWMVAHYSTSQQDAGNDSGQVTLIDAEAAQQLPDVQWQDLDGKGQNLNQFLGKVVVVNHWAPWCEPCREEIPLFMDIQAAKAQQGLQFVGIGHDTPGNVKRFVDSMGINYPQWLAGDMQGMQWMQALGNRGSLPFTTIHDREGKMIGKKLGLLSAQELEEIIQPVL